MMKLPQQFDENEWILLLANVIFYTIIFLLPKRFPKSMTILLLLFGPTVARVSDHMLASPNLDLYNLMDGPTYELFDLFTYSLYAPFSYIFIYIFDRWNIRGYGIVIYILLFASGGGGLEWGFQRCHIFTYKGWMLSYSFNYYILTEALELLFYKVIKKAYRE